MSISTKTLKVEFGASVFVLLAPLWATGQTLAPPKKVDFCAVVASSHEYDGQAISAQVILSPSEHSLSVYGAACVPKEGYDVTTQAILPAVLESLPNGKKLGRILKRHRLAKVELVGIFESTGGRYGPDAARFRFSITEIKSVADGALDRSHQKINE